MYKRGEIVVIPFPFSDSSKTKKRPALIISNSKVNHSGDYLMVQITTKEKDDGLSLPLHKEDFSDDPLPLRSFIRIHKIFSLNESLILYKASSLNDSFLKKLSSKIVSLIE